MRQYLQGRGVTVDEISRYRLGFCPSELRLPSCTQEFWEWAARYAFGALVFPLTDPLGKVIGLQVRGGAGATFGAKAENFLLKPRELCLPCFGLHIALPAIFGSDRAITVEGVFDYFATVKVAPDVLCTLTASVSLGQKRLLARYASQVICLFDMDKTGRRGAYKLAGLPIPVEYQLPIDLTRNRWTPKPPPYHVSIPSYSEHDPNDLYRAGKIEELAKLTARMPLARR